MNRKQGFTIVELLIVIVIIGILASLIIVAYNGIQQRAQSAKRKADTGVMMKWLELYYADNGTYPASNSGTDYLVTTSMITGSTTTSQLRALIGSSSSIQDPLDQSTVPIITNGYAETTGKYFYTGGFYYPGVSGSTLLTTRFGTKGTIYCGGQISLTSTDRYAASVFSYYDNSSDTIQIFTTSHGTKPINLTNTSKCIWH
ncbi:MAG: prepilin-type N-terminal cleavage/methylation domain-containing protein [Patescibacteria group bacterium]